MTKEKENPGFMEAIYRKHERLMLQRQLQHLFLYIPIFCTVGLFGFGGINMDNKYLNEVLERLESYRKKEQQIELLRYELQRIK